MHLRRDPGRRRTSILALAAALAGVMGCYPPEDKRLERDLDYLMKVGKRAAEEEIIAIRNKQIQLERNLPIPKDAQVEELFPPGSPRPQWKLTLEQCIAMALQYNSGLKVQSFSPAIAEAVLQEQLAAFDAVFVFNADNTSIERPTPNILDGASAGSQFVTLSDSKNFDWNVVKPFVTGAEARLTYRTAWSSTNSSVIDISPSYTSAVEVALNQPLLQGFGIDYNRTNIRVASIEKDRNTEELRRTLNDLLFSVEQAYWALMFRYRDVESKKASEERGLETWRIQQAHMEVGRASVPSVAATVEQHARFRAERFESEGLLETAEHGLRRVIGLPVRDGGPRLFPASTPTEVLVEPNWEVAIADAFTHFPELRQQKLLEERRELERRQVRHALLPELNAQLRYAYNGLGSSLGRSNDQIADLDFQEWTIGLNFRMPFGFRAGHAQNRRARLTVEQEKHSTEELSKLIRQNVMTQISLIRLTYQSTQARKNQLKASQELLRAEEEYFKEGRTTLADLLEAQEHVAAAEFEYNEALALYNIALAQLEAAKGTLAQYNNVFLEEDLLLDEP